jgi:hypothetical protein
LLGRHSTRRAISSSSSMLGIINAGVATAHMRITGGEYAGG